jgi:hypothetical protein
MEMKTKKLAQLVLTLMLTVFLTFGGATLAIFSGSAQNSGNVAHAGTIDLTAKRDHGDYTPGPMFYSDSLDPAGNHPYDKSKISPSGEALGAWAPGDIVKRTMILTNEGSLDAKLTGIKATARAAYTQNLLTGGSSTVTGFTSGPAYDEFIQKANVTVALPDQSLTLYNGPLSGLISTGNGYATLLNQPVLQGTFGGFGSGPLNITFEVHLDNSASNEVQGKSFIFDFGFYSEQVRNNNGNQTNQVTVTVAPNQNKVAGYINVPASASNLVLDVSSLFHNVDANDFPDLTITSPNGETFGYTGTYLSGSGSSGSGEDTTNTSSSKATYTGYQSNPEQMTFTNPIQGKWTVEISNSSGTVSSTATVEANLPIGSN